MGVGAIIKPDCGLDFTPERRGYRLKGAMANDPPKVALELHSEQKSVPSH